MADVGSAQTLRDLGVHRKRISKGVLPNHMLAMHSDDPEAARAKLMPDIMIFEVTLEERRYYSHVRPNDKYKELSSRLCKRTRQICIIEWGYWYIVTFSQYTVVS